MSEKEAQAAPKDRPTSSRRRPGRPFPKGSPGRPKGSKDIRTSVGIETARLLSARAVERLTALLTSRSQRVSLEACKVVLSYAWGLPRATLELTGGFGDLSKELSLALAEARARRAALDASQPVAGLLDAAEGIPAASGAEASALVAKVVPTIEREVACSIESQSEIVQGVDENDTEKVSR